MEFGPPGATVVGYLVNKIAGAGEVVFRLPAMIGFWGFCLCLFGFAARRVSIFFALSALLLPFATWGEAYSVEARGYSLVLGCCGVALYCWQTATAGKKRGLSLLGLTLAIGAAILFNYYAVFILLPLAGAEVVRSLERRQIDWPIWASLVLGGVSLSSFLSYSQGMHIRPFSVAQKRDYLTFYTDAFGKSLWFLVPVLVLISAWLLLLIPVAAITLALVVPPHTFTDRYALPAIGGFALLSSLLAAHFAGGRSAVGLAFATAAFLPFAYAMTQGRTLTSPLDQRPMLRQAAGEGPVVLTDFLTVLPTWYYASEPVRSHLIGLADEQLWLQSGHINQHVEGFRRFGVPMASYQDLTSSGKPFRLYLTPGLGWWLPQKFLADGGRLEVLQWEEDHVLLLVHPK